MSVCAGVACLPAQRLGSEHIKNGLGPCFKTDERWNALRLSRHLAPGAQVTPSYRKRMLTARYMLPWPDTRDTAL
jgi:hypothetical protein